MTTFTIAVSDEMELGIFADGDGDPETAKADLQKLLDILGEDPDTIELDVAGPIENHRSGERAVRVHDLTHEKGVDMAGM